MAKILVDREVLEQALEALEYENSWHTHHKVKPYVSTIDAIAALRVSLDQAEEVFEHDFTEYEPDPDTGFVK